MLDYKSIIQPLTSKLFSEKEITVSVLRLDLIHEQVSGNKWFKLKYNLAAAKKRGHHTILTFGGAFSNHIHATAAACKMDGFNAIGVIRGEKTSENNSTLSKARELGMELYFVSREKYKSKSNPEFLNALEQKFGKFYMVPEGGNNLEGALGCAEILEGISSDYNQIFTACGTSTTFAGLAKSLRKEQNLIGISVLKGEQTMLEDIRSLLKEMESTLDISDSETLLASERIEGSGVINSYHFGGYAKHTPALLDFKSEFELSNKIPLDYVYTAKLFYAVYDLANKDKFKKNDKVLVIHSGGLQGNEGYEDRYALNPRRIVSDAQG